VSDLAVAAASGEPGAVAMDPERHPDGGSLAFLAGGGEMGRRARAFDWSRTPLGDPEAWPSSLKTAARIMLNSRFPMFVWWGPELVNLYNDAYVPMLGKRHPDALGRPAAEIWSEIWPTIGPQTEAVLRRGEATWSSERLLVLERNGFAEEAYFTFSYSPIPGDDGGVGGLYCAVIEDTARVLGERRLRTLRELAARTTDSARSAVDACRIAALCLSGNRHDLPFALVYLLDGDVGALRLAGVTGLAEGSPAAPPSVDPSGATGPAPAWPFAEALGSGRPVVVADLGARFGPLPGGAWPEPARQAVVVPIARPGQATHAGLLVAGLSPRLEYDEAYRGFTASIAVHLATAIANARAYEEERRRAEALAEIDRAKTAFFSNVSHEFRTPLTLLLGPLQDALGDPAGPSSAAQRERLEVALRNGLRLQKLVNSLLDFSRIEAGRIRATYEPTDLALFTADLASNFRSACAKAGLALRVDCPPLGEPVFVDRQMWEKIVLNLISNAFKFTFEGEIAVTLRRSGGCAELRVRDTGTGIPADEMPRLFERFHRVENARGRTHEGSGIGLALVQELVKLHGGRVAAESEPDRGTTFVVSIPFGRDHLAAGRVREDAGGAARATGAGAFVEEALRWLPDDLRHDGAGGAELPRLPDPLLSDLGETRERRPNERLRVLVVDDNADVRQYLARLLGDHYAVETVPDGEAALAAVRRRPPDLVLSDAMMPRLDGFGLLRELRADPRLANLPVIVLSARAGEESQVEGMQAGADDYLVKPFSARELLARVAAHLKMARLREEAGESLRASEERFRSLFESLDEAFCVVELLHDAGGRAVDYRFLEANPPFAKHTGLGSAVGRTMRELVPDPDPQWLEVFGRVAATGRSVRFVSEAREGGRWLDVHAYRLGGAGSRKVGILFNDVTERKRIDDELRQMAADLAEADRRKDEFLATLAHELRNPLAPLRNGLEVLKRGVDDGAAGENVRAMMERQLAQLVQLVDDLLDLSRISHGKIELRRQRVALSDVVQRAVETSRPLIEQRRHALDVTLPPRPLHVEADPTRLAQVFSNLLNNAARYTEPGGRISLAAQRVGGHAVVSVRDTGVGIPQEMLPKLFEMFSQFGSPLDRSQGGLGIGLSLVKRLVELHGGSVGARSDGPGKGSEFVVRLPLVPSPRAARSEAEPGQAASGGRRILVVDDNRDAADSLAMMLRLTGHETRTAHDGLAALEAGADFRPDLVLLDIGMPRLNGYEAARRIRREPWGRAAFLVALTGWGQDEDRRRSREAGFDAHLTKPCDLGALRELLDGLAGPSRSPRSSV
jgi:PAS domain S-box-containing protein